MLSHTQILGWEPLSQFNGGNSGAVRKRRGQVKDKRWRKKTEMQTCGVELTELGIMARR